jgi:hypothetical protein
MSPPVKSKGHILVDFDRTLAEYSSWEEQGAKLGSPIQPMVERVKRWLAAGKEVRIFTARASFSNPRMVEDMTAIRKWCEVFLGKALTVTNEKDFNSEAIWDDIAMTVEANTGWRWTALADNDINIDPLSIEEEMDLTGYSKDTKSVDVDSSPES